MITQVAAAYLPIQSQLNYNHKEQEVHLRIRSVIIFPCAITVQNCDDF